jgi:hypothetical protein
MKQTKCKYKTTKMHTNSEKEYIKNRQEKQK